MTQTELAAAVGVRQGMISAYENGTLPTVPIALRIAKLFGVSVEELLCDNYDSVA